VNDEILSPGIKARYE